ncbi:MAG: beta-lactamase family protein [Alphaproteobacteria bacterium]|nr:beta-lactamase family protein [Alphaproteobacteria bacterium]
MVDRIDRALAEAVAGGDVHGVVAAAATDTGVIYQGAHGVRAVGDRQPMTPDTVLRLFSMTKAITAVAAMQQVERGKLSLDGPIADVLPQLAKPQVLEGFDAGGKPILRAARSPITLRQLLTHTAGFGYENWNGDIQKYMQVTGLPGLTTGKLESLNAPLTFDPGTRWQYSISIDWAGRAVEAVSGQDLEAYFRQHIFTPLGMQDTSFRLRPDQQARRATPHARQPDGTLQTMTLVRSEEPEFLGGGGGLFGTIPDYLAFLRALLAQGGGLVKPETFAEMARNNMGDLFVETLRTFAPAMSLDANLFPDIPQKWGLSFSINTRATPEGRAAGSLAWAGLGNLYFWVDPTKRVAGVWGTQILPFCDTRSVKAFKAFETAVYDSL